VNLDSQELLVCPDPQVYLAPADHQAIPEPLEREDHQAMLVYQEILAFQDLQAIKEKGDPLECPVRSAC